MKALVYYGPSDMRMIDWKDPKPEDGEVLLKSIAVGICGSDVHGYLGLTGRRIPPMIMGHEVVAEVVENKKQGSRYKKGDLVFVDPISVCKTCENCRNGNTSICLNKKNIGVLDVDGAFCEYFKIKEENLILLPADVPTKVGVLAEPFSVALHGVCQLDEWQRPESIAVIGAGVIGLSTAAVLHERYPEAVIVLIDLSKKRLERGHEVLGGFLNTESLEDSTYEKMKHKYTSFGFDAVFEAVGVEPAVNGALDLVKSKGTVVLIGNNQKNIHMNYQQIITRELIIKGTYGFTHEDLEESIKAFSRRPYAAAMIDGTISLEQAKTAFDELAENGENYLKLIVDPTL
ncbi:MAG: zinc-dependent alcohol dehydrogenase [Blautia sp.]|jgi:threonine dehydrogenase-like Zn-dependent dehydrogenase